MPPGTAGAERQLSPRLAALLILMAQVESRHGGFFPSCRLALSWHKDILISKQPCKKAHGTPLAARHANTRTAGWQRACQQAGCCVAAGHWITSRGNQLLTRSLLGAVYTRA